MAVLLNDERSSRPVVVVRLCNWIGDVVLSLPALELLEAHGYALHLYGKAWMPSLLSGYEWPMTVRAASLRDRVSQLKGIRQQYFGSGSPLIQGRRSPQALAMPNSFSSALELRLAGLTVSGYARDGRSLLLAQRQKPGPEPHALESFWRLAGQFVGDASIGLPPANIRFKLRPGAIELAQHLAQSHGLGTDYVCIAPFASGTVHKQSKKWPGFSELVSKMVSSGVKVVVCPGPGEEQDAAALYGGAICLSDVPLDVYAVLLSQASLVVANDTGPAHIAAAVGAPLISVLGPTQVALWRPWGETVKVISRHPVWPSVQEIWEQVVAHLEGQAA